MSEYPIARLLDLLIEESDEGLAQVQILFKPGANMQAGAVRRHEKVDGLYEFCTPTQAGADLPGIKMGEMVMVNIAFVPDAVLQVITMIKTSGIISGAGVDIGGH